MAAIRIEKVCKNFGSFQALTDISLLAADKEFTVLLGPSGSGKTSLLRTVAGLEEASSGSIYIADKNVSALAPKDRNLAMVFQNYAVFPHMSVAENIAFGLKTKGVSKQRIAEQTKKSASLLHIENILSKYPSKLSGGQRQRVSVARALAVEPEVMLMDEPLSNLDALLRLEMRSELKALLRKSQTTTLYVTHDQIEAMSMADKIAVMNQGSIMQFDTPEAIYFRPEHEFVARFIGNPPMNLFEVKKIQSQSSISMAVINSQIAFQIPKNKKTTLQREIKTAGLLVGIRAESLFVENAKKKTKSSLQAYTKTLISASVLTIEHLGASTMLVLEAEDQVFRVLGRYDINLFPGQLVSLKYSPAKLLFFSKESGRVILRK